MIDHKYTFNPHHTYKVQLEQDINDMLRRNKVVPKQIFVERHVYNAMFGKTPSGRFAYRVALEAPCSFFDAQNPQWFPSPLVHEVEIIPEGA